MPPLPPLVAPRSMPFGDFTGISHCKLTSSERFDAVIELEFQAICRAICAKNARLLCFKINMRFGIGRRNENVMCRIIERKIRQLPDWLPLATPTRMRSLGSPPALMQSRILFASFLTTRFIWSETALADVSLPMHLAISINVRNALEQRKCGCAVQKNRVQMSDPCQFD